MFGGVSGIAGRVLHFLPGFVDILGDLVDPPDIRLDRRAFHSAPEQLHPSAEMDAVGDSQVGIRCARRREGHVDVLAAEDPRLQFRIVLDQLREVLEGGFRQILGGDLLAFHLVVDDRIAFGKTDLGDYAGDDDRPHRRIDYDVGFRDEGDRVEDFVHGDVEVADRRLDAQPLGDRDLAEQADRQVAVGAHVVAPEVRFAAEADLDRRRFHLELARHRYVLQLEALDAEGILPVVAHRAGQAQPDFLLGKLDAQRAGEIESRVVVLHVESGQQADLEGHVDDLQEETHLLGAADLGWLGLQETRQLEPALLQVIQAQALGQQKFEIEAERVAVEQSADGAVDHRLFR